MEPIAVTLPEACRIAGIGRTKLYEEIQAGRLSARKAGRRVLILTADLRKYIEGLPATNLREAA